MQLPQLSQDKANHALYGLAIYLAAALLLGPLHGLAVALLAGVAKEAVDATGRGRVELLDLAATAAGALAGLACTLAL